MTVTELQHDAEYIGRPVNPEYGKNAKSGKKELRLFMEIVEGPLAGRRIKYTANTKDQKSTAYAKRDLMAAGWKGKDPTTFVADVTANASTKMPFTVRLAHNERDGQVSEWWTVGSIGKGAAPLVATTKDDDREVAAWFAEAGEIHSANGSHPNAPDNNDSDPPPF